MAATKFLGSDQLAYFLGKLKTVMSTMTDDAKTKYEYVTGEISTVSEPKENTFYLQRDDATATTYKIYLFNGTAMVEVGGDVSTETLESMELTESEIDSLFDSVFNPTTPSNDQGDQTNP